MNVVSTLRWLLTRHDESGDDRQQQADTERGEREEVLGVLVERAGGDHRRDHHAGRHEADEGEQPA